MNDSGFTLIELLIAMTISILVAAGVVTAYRSQQNTQLAQQQTVEMQQTLRVALDIMSREIRMAGYDPDGSNGAGIINAGDGSDNANRLQFTYFNNDTATDGKDNDNDGTIDEADEDIGNDGADNDNDGTIDQAGEVLQAVEFYLYDSTIDSDNLVDDLGRRNGARLDVIAENIQTLLFVYFDTNGAPTTTPEDIRAVQITIVATIASNELNYTSGNHTLTTTVKCRNLIW